MSNLVLTNIRLSKDELLEYRQMALSEGKSFSQYVRDILHLFTHQVKTMGKANLLESEIKKKRNEESLWKLTKWNSKIKDGAKNHDKYIY